MLRYFSQNNATFDHLLTTIQVKAYLSKFGTELFLKCFPLCVIQTEVRVSGVSSHGRVRIIGRFLTRVLSRVSGLVRVTVRIWKNKTMLINFRLC